MISVQQNTLEIVRPVPLVRRSTTGNIVTRRGGVTSNGRAGHFTCLIVEHSRKVINIPKRVFAELFYTQWRDKNSLSESDVPHVVL